MALAEITSTFALAYSASPAGTLHRGLDTYTRLQQDIAILRTQVGNEKQISRRVELNLEIKRLEAEQVYSKDSLQQGDNP